MTVYNYIYILIWHNELSTFVNLDIFFVTVSQQDSIEGVRVGGFLGILVSYCNVFCIV